MFRKYDAEEAESYGCKDGCVYSLNGNVTDR